MNPHRDVDLTKQLLKITMKFIEELQRLVQDIKLSEDNPAYKVDIKKPKP